MAKKVAKHIHYLLYYNISHTMINSDLIKDINFFSILDQWTTFLKARLNCSIAGDYPFYYDEIQSAYYEKSEGIVYATFTTPENSIAGTKAMSFEMLYFDLYTHTQWAGQRILKSSGQKLVKLNDFTEFTYFWTFSESQRIKISMENFQTRIS